MDDAHLGGYNEFLGRVFFGIFQQATGRSDVVGLFEQGCFTFRVGNEFRIRMTLTQSRDFLLRKDLMNHAGAIPKDHIPAGLFLQVGAQIFIRGKDDRFVFRNAVDNLHGIGGSAADIRKCL